MAVKIYPALSLESDLIADPGWCRRATWFLHLISKRWCPLGQHGSLRTQKEAGRKGTTAALPGVSHIRSTMTVWESQWLTR